jgi:histidinol-phosphatase (PHP family)
VLKWDGHTHTKYCYHGSNAEEEMYLDSAIRQGFERFSLTEHPPLPAGWIADEALFRELAMPEEELALYMEYAQRMKQKYEGKIEVLVGLELDYLHGRTSFMDRLVDRWQDRLEDAVISVHYLPGAGGMRCIDFTADDFRQGLLAHYGSMNAVVDEYFNHVEAAIAWAQHLPIARKRLGHIDLIGKFRLALPPFDETAWRRRLESLLSRIKAAGIGIDVNTAGLRVATCGKPYVPEWFLQRCREQGIELVFGSDAHKPEHAGAGWEWFEGRICGSSGSDG